jgi:hypothetical protein
MAGHPMEGRRKEAAKEDAPKEIEAEAVAENAPIAVEVCRPRC